MNFPKSMGALNRFFRFLRHVPEFFERRNFRKKTREEKVKKYLAPREKPQTDRIISILSDPRRRFRFVSTFYSKLEAQKDRFSLQFALLGALLVTLVSYVAFVSPYFRISPGKVIIERLDSGSDVNIAYKSIEKTYGKPIFSADSHEIAALVTDMQKNIRSVEVSRLYPNGLKIILSSYPPEFSTYFKTTERSYGITENGILIYQRSKSSELPVLDIIDKSLSESEFLEYKEGVPSAKMVRIVRVRKAIETLFPGLHFSKFTFFRTEQELHVAFESGVRVLISLDGTEDTQIQKLRFWNAQAQNPLSSGGISYVDLRIPTKIFICRNEALCKKNLINIYDAYYKN